jgi:hypothetical protein
MTLSSTRYLTRNDAARRLFAVDLRSCAARTPLDRLAGDIAALVPINVGWSPKGLAVTVLCNSSDWAEALTRTVAALSCSLPELCSLTVRLPDGAALSPATAIVRARTIPREWPRTARTRFEHSQRHSLWGFCDVHA